MEKKKQNAIKIGNKDVIISKNGVAFCQLLCYNKLDLILKGVNTCEEENYLPVFGGSTYVQRNFSRRYLCICGI